jgi:hypothetical protein
MGTRYEDRRSKNDSLVDLVYIGIPKNAYALQDLGWGWRRVAWGERSGWINRNRELQGKFPEHAQYFSIARDPIDRWVSGITQTFYRNRDDILSRMFANITPFVEDPWFDQHQAPQFCFVDGWPNLTSFKIENLDLLCEWLKERGTVMPQLLVHNAASIQEPRWTIYNRIKDCLTDRHKEMLREFYANDVEYYENSI